MDGLGRDTGTRAAFLASKLQAVGLAVSMQAARSGGGSSSGSQRGQHMAAEEVSSMVQAAKSTACGVVLLTKEFIRRVEQGAFGDVCVAGFTLAKRLPNVVVLAMEPDLAYSGNWGWNQVFARLSGKVNLDFSADVLGDEWERGVVELARLLGSRGVQPLLAVTPSIAESSVAGTARSTPRSSAGPLSSTASEEGAVDYTYDCFVSHCWDTDGAGRDNHHRVLRAAQFLQRSGLSVFVGDWENHRFQNDDEAMVYGARHASVVIIFLTRKYIERIEAGHVSDNCVAEFNLAKCAQHVVLVIMEEELLTLGAKGWSKAFAHFAGRSFVDLSNDCGTSVWSQLWNDGVQRWYCALSALEVRVRECNACAARLRFAPPPPLVPHRDLVVTIAVCLAVAGCLFFFADAGCATHAALDVASLAACTAWAAAMCLSALWLLHGARTPPGFEINSLMIPRLAVVAVLLQLVGVGLRATQPVFCLLGDDDEEVLALAGNYVLLAGSALALAETAIAPWDRDRGLDRRAACALQNMRHWPKVSASLAACFFTLAAHLESKAVLVLAACALVASALVLATWVLRSPGAVRRHYEAMAHPLCDDEAPCQGGSPQAGSRQRQKQQQQQQKVDACNDLKEIAAESPADWSNAARQHARPPHELHDPDEKVPFAFLHNLAQDHACTLDITAASPTKIAASVFGNSADDFCERRFPDPVTFFVLQRVESVVQPAVGFAAGLAAGTGPQLQQQQQQELVPAYSPDDAWVDNPLAGLLAEPAMHPTSPTHEVGPVTFFA